VGSTGFDQRLLFCRFRRFLRAQAAMRARPTTKSTVPTAPTTIPTSCGVASPLLEADGPGTAMADDVAVPVLASWLSDVDDRDTKAVPEKLSD